MEGILALLVPYGFFAAIVVPVIFLSRYRHNERMELIRQGINPINQMPGVTGRGPLAWGLIFTFVGIALFISYFILGDKEVLVGAAIVASPGIAMLVYYKVTTPERERMMRRYEEQAIAGNDVPGVTPQTSAPTGPANEQENTEMQT